jgi:uroporphyrinogen decarboxylase
MNSAERIRALINRDPFDRVGVAGWVHMPLTDTNPEDFIRAAVSFTDYCRWDFIKIMSNAHFISSVFGAEIDFSRDPEQWKGDYLRYPIRNLEDAKNITVQDDSNPTIQREVQIVKGIRERYRGLIPAIATVFSPLMSFQEMTRCGDSGPTLEFVRHHPGELRLALEVITKTIINMTDAQIAAGADGVFFATQFATDILSDAEFDGFCREYDLRVLEHIKNKTWFNVLHVHGDRGLKFKRLLDYPVQAFNWENAAAGIPEKELSSVAAVRELTDKVLITGLDKDNDFPEFHYDREALKKRYRERLETVIRQSGDKRVIFGPGCAMNMKVNHYVYSLISDVVDEFGRI